MAATPFDLPVTAAQVGTFFVGRYYQVLQQQPDFIHRFYSNASTMVRVDGTIRETASAVLQIHTLVMSLNYTGVEIKAAHSLESWNGGVLVMVSGSVHLKNFNVRRKFVQTFFLAPQEIGYLVLNDIFHFTDDEDQVLQLPVTYLTPTIHDSKLNASTDFQDQVPNGEDFQAREFVVPGTVEDNFPAENYSFPEQRLQQVSETELFLEGNFAVQSNGSLQSTIKTVDEHSSTPMEEPIVEPQKHTYASIVAKGQSAPAVPVQSSYNKTSPPASEWSHVPEPSSHSSFSPSVTVDGLRAEPVEEVSAPEDEVEVKSVYVKNVPSTASASEIKEEFKKFGKLKPNAVAIITRKDVGVCYRYAFVEFDDISGVQNAIKASTVEIAGQPVYIEGRKANRFNAFRGGRGRGRGRGSYHMDASRGRFDARDSSRSNGQDGDYSSRSGGSGYYRPKSRQGSRNGSSNQSD